MLRLGLPMTAIAAAVVLTGCRFGATYHPSPNLPEVKALISRPPEQTVAATPDQPPPFVGGPAARTIRTDQLPPRPLTLNDCVAYAAHYGRLGDVSVQVFAIDPALARTEVNEAVARFDPRLGAGTSFSRVENPIGTAAQGALDPNDTAKVYRQYLANANAGVSKALPTGGLVGITTRLDYENVNLPARVNPAYRPGTVFTFEQPLLLGAGRRNNLLRPVHPTAGTVGPALLFAINGLEQSQAEFNRRLQDVLFNVTQAYWNLYSSYLTLYSRDAALAQAAAQLESARQLVAAGRITAPDLAQIEGEYWQFYGDRIRALGGAGGNGGVLEAERQLRLAIGFPPEDGTRLVPADVPVTAPFTPDWQTATAEALAQRPELARARLELAAARLAVERDANDLLPDLRLTGSYDLHSLGDQFGGGGGGDALRNLFVNPSSTWSIGMRLDLPIWFRAANARYRRSVLQKYQRAAALQLQEDQVVYGLQRSYRQVAESQEVFAAQRRRREVAAREVNTRAEQFRAGQGLLVNLLLARRNWADALRDEFAALADYNVALADFERQKGTLTTYTGVFPVTGPYDTHLGALTRIAARTAVAPQVTTAPTIDPTGPVPEIDSPLPIPVLFERVNPTGPLPPETQPGAPRPLPAILPAPRPAPPPAAPAPPPAVTPAAYFEPAAVPASVVKAASQSEPAAVPAGVVRSASQSAPVSAPAVEAGLWKRAR